MLPPRVLGQVFEWAAIHQQELLADWALVGARQPPNPIPPLASNTFMITSLHDVRDVEVLGRYRLRLTFSDGLVGDVDLSHLQERDGVFTPLHDPAFFGQVRVDPEISTITWPNGADLAPEVLYDRAAAHLICQPRHAAAG